MLGNTPRWKTLNILITIIIPCDPTFMSLVGFITGVHHPLFANTLDHGQFSCFVELDYPESFDLPHLAHEATAVTETCSHAQLGYWNLKLVQDYPQKQSHTLLQVLTSHTYVFSANQSIFRGPQTHVYP